MALCWDSRNDRWRVQIRSFGNRDKRISRLLPPGITETEARAIHDQMYGDATREALELPQPTKWEASVRAAALTPKSWLHRMEANARTRTKRRGHVMTLTLDELVAICLRSGGRCEVSGLPFSGASHGAKRLRPLSPTLDRIDCSVGYVSQNCRLVCAAVNVAMFDWGEEMFLRIAAGVVINRMMLPALSGSLSDLLVPSTGAHFDAATREPA